MIMSGGLDHALDVLAPEDFASAAGGFRYLQLRDVAKLVEQHKARPATNCSMSSTPVTARSSHGIK